MVLFDDDVHNLRSVVSSDALCTRAPREAHTSKRVVKFASLQGAAVLPSALVLSRAWKLDGSASHRATFLSPQ